MHMSRLLRLALVLTLAASLSVAGVAGSAAEDGHSVTADADGYQLTLVTGDTLHVERSGEGRWAVTAAQPTGQPPPEYQTIEDGDSFYVIPAVASPWVGERLDPELFNVPALVEQGYHDEARADLPVIVTFRDEADEPPPSFRPVRDLDSIDALAAEQDKDLATAFGDALRDDPEGTFAVIDRVWLDRSVTVALEQTTQQIHVAGARERGLDGDGVTVAVLDTGIDASHPDLEGAVVEARNFTTSFTDTDRHGHGTHVASIIAGSGAASDGRYGGVAPGVELLNGKVIGDGGSGQFSWIIAGMEWAAESGATIANLSIGGDPTDGTDPLSEAVDQLTGQYGTLFVAAAGNRGPAERSVTTPGAASRALTVGAVDRDDQLAAFSSRGPRRGDDAVKPDITAPGVGVVAARASGTSMGSPVDSHYTAASGTSMATPHVAATAALLAQQHAEWSAQELKQAALTTGTVVEGFTVYEQGGGRVDVTDALDATVRVRPGLLDLGVFRYPHDDHEPATRALRLANDGGDAVDLQLQLDLRDADGDAAPAALATLADEQVTVPAGGEAEAEIIVDATVGEIGWYTGFLHVTDALGAVGHALVTLNKEPELYRLRVEALLPNGSHAGSVSAPLTIMNVDDRSVFFEQVALDGESVERRVPPGRYAVASIIRGGGTGATAAVAPEVLIEEDTNVLLDASEALPITLTTPEHESDPGATVTLAWHRAPAQGNGFTFSYILNGGTALQALPTDPVSVGDFEVFSRDERVAPRLRMRVVEPEREELSPFYLFGSPPLDVGTAEFRLVDAGTGTAAEFAVVKAGGAAALVRRGAGMSDQDRARNAAEAGAAFLLLYGGGGGIEVDPNGPQPASAHTLPLPTLGIGNSVGQQLSDTARRHEVVLEVLAYLRSPFRYDAVIAEAGAVTGEMTAELRPAEMAHIDTGFHTPGPDQVVDELRHHFRPHSLFSFAFTQQVDAPWQRDEYISAGDSLWRQAVFAGPLLRGQMRETGAVYEGGEVLTRSWLKQPSVPGPLVGNEHVAGIPSVRDYDTLRLHLPEFIDGDGHHGYAGVGDVARLRVYRDGTLIGEANRTRGEFGLPPQPAIVRLEADVDRAASWWGPPRSTRTAWTFPSHRPRSRAKVEPLPLPTLGYDTPVDLRNTAPGGDDLVVGLAVGHQDGAPVGSVWSVRLWASTDGDTWEPAEVTPTGLRTFQAALPALEPGAVSLRAAVSDELGNRLDQTVIDAFRIAE